MWDVVYLKDALNHEDYREITFENIPRATYCAWELGAVWHERNAWIRFLKFKRDDAAKLEYARDRLEGRV